MTELSCDYSLARPAPQAIKAAGYSAVWRYLSGGNNKDLTKSEAAALHAAGLGIGLIWETTASRALGGAAEGSADGAAAAAQAKGLGVPPAAPLLVNVGDFAATPGQIPAISDYYHAFRQHTLQWQGGGYATGYIISQLVARGNAGLWWQNAMNDAGQLGSSVSPHAGVYQRVAPTKTIAGVAPGGWDEDVTVNGATVNWWLPAGAPPPPAPAPVPSLDGQVVWYQAGTLHTRGVISADSGKTWR